MPSAQMRRVLLSVAVTVAAVGLATGCGGIDAEAGGAESSVSLQLSEQAGSGQSGTATLSAQGSKTRVVIELTNPAAGPQPSHLHQGTCENPNPQPAFALNNVVDGNAETTVDVPLAELQIGAAYHVDVHKSEAEIETVVACGNLLEGGLAGGGSGGGYGGGY